LKVTVIGFSALLSVGCSDATWPLGGQPDAGSSMRLQTTAASLGKMRRKGESHSPPQPGNQLGHADVRQQDLLK
jgi:hypothetical protein